MTILDYLTALLFGIVEGVTEWLPISSTGHMILLNEVFKLNVTPEFFDLYLVVIQLGAILAVVLVFWKQIWPFGQKDNNKPLSKSGLGSWVRWDILQMWFKIIVACIPAAIVGALFDDVFDKYFYNYLCVAIALLVFGIAFIFVERKLKGKKSRCNSISDITYGDACLIGVFQLIAAIFPGTSRSGSTILGSLLLGINRTVAAKFTFFLAIPVMFGASLLKILKYDGVVKLGEIGLLIVGMVTAFFVSLIVIRFFMNFIRKHDFTVFGWYRIVLGIIVLIAFIH